MVRKKIRLVVKAYPEKSKKHGSSICTAGLVDDKEWIRIYPVDLNYYNRNKDKFKKWNLIEAEVEPNKEKIYRKESHKVRERTIQLVDESLVKNLKKKGWEKRSKIILSKLDTSVEELKARQKEDGTSLGIIKPKQYKFVFRKDIEKIRVKKEKSIQKDLLGERLITPDEIEKIFAYKFICDHPECKGHDMICEDWELIGLFRKYWKDKEKPSIIKEKLTQKFDTWMREERDLYFILGTTHMFGTWVIIGLYYPPKKEFHSLEEFLK